MHQNRGINRTFVPIIVRVGLTLPVFPSVYYQHRIIRRTTPGQNRYAMTFQELNLIEPLKRAVAEKGYTTPTPIQQQAIPPALEVRQDTKGRKCNANHAAGKYPNARSEDKA